MIEQFTSYFTKLEQLSSDELRRSAEKLVVSENTTIAKLIAHLAEMSSRKTALKLGYKSLFDYCISSLNLSEGAVPARIHVANVSRRFPQLLVALAESRISLTVAALLAPHLTENNVKELISDCAGMTRRETEEYLVVLKPKPVFEPSIRKRPSTSDPTATVPELSPRDKPAPSASPSPRPVETPKSSPTILQPAREEVFNFRFSADKSFKDKFERLAEVTGVENAQKHMAEILETALDIRSRRKTRRGSSSGEERGRAAPRRNLVQTRLRKKMSRPSLDTLRPRSPSAFTSGIPTNVPIGGQMGGDVPRGWGCTSTIRNLLASFEATMSP